MRKIIIICLLWIVILGNPSCREIPVEAGFEDIEETSIYEYMMENDSAFSGFLTILEKGGIAKTLSAYNPEGQGYTLFLPDNDALNRFIEASGQYSSLDDLLNDPEYVSELDGTMR